MNFYDRAKAVVASNDQSERSELLSAGVDEFSNLEAQLAEANAEREELRTKNEFLSKRNLDLFNQYVIPEGAPEQVKEQEVKKGFDFSTFK